MLHKNEKRVVVGIGVIVFKDGKILLGKRKTDPGAGEFALPGGLLEHGETITEGAQREVLEETGIKIKDTAYVATANALNYPPTHCLLIGVSAHWEYGDPEVKEPSKHESWAWCSVEETPQPFFRMSAIILHCFHRMESYMDEKHIQQFFPKNNSFP
ncbi:MAG: NUDIX hydrolase [Parcubacteria group bacterium Gr01-1014_18]|nr:MAG: NUDIX hydrolase [Parcubacteria group bacterium Greene0416_36]TSC81080.1 MAG: NUDIX hydrolase [Parcubacteria group bacterium Gr01-1014_18]TSC98814.1 MAG: NUDIX hydrolase [Parcubacteria group bacterium Greene1014_20]TSD06706.1 MAG: NUDIX hydrolase [Parcubacteria group bacterium Greene0714_2]